MTGNAFGSLATLVPLCLGELTCPDPDAAVFEHYDVWHSCLIVVREVIKADSEAAESLGAVLSGLMDVADELRDGYVRILRSRVSEPAVARSAFGRLKAAYERLVSLVEELGVALDLDLSFMPAARSLRRVAFERSLKGLGDMLGA